MNNKKLNTLNLLSIAEQCKGNFENYWNETVEVDSVNNFKVNIQFKDGNIKYINYFIAPNGKIIDFWDEKIKSKKITKYLKMWQGKKDILRIIERAKKKKEYRYLEREIYEY